MHQKGSHCNLKFQPGSMTLMIQQALGAVADDGEEINI